MNRASITCLTSTCVPLLLAGALPLAAAAAEESATFRLGPGRNGVAADSVSLRADYPADLAPLWTSEGPGGAKGMGGASPTVAEGKVFVYATDPEDKAAHEQVYCLDAATGKRLWLKTFPGKPSAYGCHSTPAVGGGRAYVGGRGTLWCLNAQTGDVIWEQDSAGPGASSPLLVDGMVICGNGGTRAYEAASGKPLWEVEGATATHSPAAWIHDGTTYLIATVTGKKAPSQFQCIDPADGKVVWTVDVPGGLKHTTPAISGDLLAVAGGKQLSVLRLAPDGATVITQTKDKGGRGTAPIVVDGRSIITGRKGGCVRYEVTDGELQESWKSKATIRGGMSSPSFADGKIFGLIQLDKKKYDKKGRTFSYPIAYTRVVVVDAATGQELGIFGEKLGIIMVSPVIADGKLYVRGPHGITCWDLTGK